MNESLSIKNKAKWPVSRWVWFGLGMGVFGVTLIIGSVTIARVVIQQQNLNDDARMRIMDEGMDLRFSSIPLQPPLNGSVLYLELWQAKDSLRLDVEIALIDSLESRIAVDTLHFSSDTLLSEGHTLLSGDGRDAHAPLSIHDYRASIDKRCFQKCSTA